jgi:hypothetical protein
MGERENEGFPLTLHPPTRPLPTYVRITPENLAELTRYQGYRSALIVAQLVENFIIETVIAASEYQL